jgi:hypothetical protein
MFPRLLRRLAPVFAALTAVSLVAVYFPLGGLSPVEAALTDTLSVSRTHTVLAPSGDIQYTVTASAPAANVDPVTITAVTDSVVSGPQDVPVCANLTTPPTTLLPGGTATCTFTRTAPPGATVADTVKVTFTGADPLGPLDPGITFLVADDEFIDVKYLDHRAVVCGPGLAPCLKDFTAAETNDDHSGIPERSPLNFFLNNTGATITLPAGQTDGAGIFRITDVPTSWANTGPTSDGLRNFFGEPAADFNGFDVKDEPVKEEDFADGDPRPHAVGFGLGNGNNPESLLTGVPAQDYNSAAELETLVTKDVCFLVRDGDVDGETTLKGFKGEHLGVAGARILAIDASAATAAKLGASSSTLPALQVQIFDPFRCGGRFTAAKSAPYSVTTPGQPGEINVTKIVAGDGDGTFDFTFDPAGDPPAVDFDLGAGDTRAFEDLTAGTYVITETDETGFDLTGITCNQGASVVTALDAGTVTITLDPGENVSCTYTNQAEEVIVIPPAPGEINVTKIVAGDGDGTFDFTFDPAGDPPAVDFDLGAGDTRAFEDLTAGTYVITETDETGFDLTGITCNQGASVVTALDAGTVTITLDPGENVSCTYTNQAEVDPIDPVDPVPPTTNPPATTTDVVSTVVQQPTSPPATDTISSVNDSPSPQLTLPTATPTPAAELPRTGARGIQEATFLALALMIIGMSARAFGRRRGRPATS